MSRIELGPDAPKGCNGKPGFTGHQAHKKAGEDSCEDCKAAYRWYQTVRRMGPKYVRPTAASSRVQTDYYPYKHGSRYYHLEKDRDEAAWRDRVRKAAKRAGWAYDTIEDLIKFDTQRGIRQREIEMEKRSQLIIKAKRKEAESSPAKVKKLVNSHLAQGVGEFIKTKPRRSTIEDAEKLELIKQMIEDRTPIMDFMIRTSQLVGANLKGNNGNG